MELTKQSALSTTIPEGGIMFERYTDRARRVVILAQHESESFRHNYVGTEHILLGLLLEGDGTAYQTLESLNITYETVWNLVSETIGPNPLPRKEGHIPFTPRAKEVLELALRESLELGHVNIGTEHILLGLLREERLRRESEQPSAATQLFEKLNYELTDIRQCVLELLGGTYQPPPVQMQDAREAFVPKEPSPALTKVQQALAQVLIVHEKLRVEEEAAIQALAICTGAKDIVGEMVDPQVAVLEAELHNVQTKLDELSEIEDSFRAIIEAGRASKGAVQGAVVKFRALFS